MEAIAGALAVYGKVIAQLKLQKAEAEKVLADGPDAYFQGMLDVLTINIKGLQHAQAALTAEFLASDLPPMPVPTPPPKPWNVLEWISQLPTK